MSDTYLRPLPRRSLFEACFISCIALNCDTMLHQRDMTGFPFWNKNYRESLPPSLLGFLSHIEEDLPNLDNQSSRANTAHNSMALCLAGLLWLWSKDGYAGAGLFEVPIPGETRSPKAISDTFPVCGIIRIDELFDAEGIYGDNVEEDWKR